AVAPCDPGTRLSLEEAGGNERPIRGVKVRGLSARSSRQNAAETFVRTVLHHCRAARGSHALDESTRGSRHRHTVLAHARAVPEVRGFVESEAGLDAHELAFFATHGMEAILIVGAVEPFQA